MEENISKIIDLIGNSTKLKICFVLNKNRLSLSEVYSELKNQFKIKIYKDNVYRNLENILKSKLIDKSYDISKKKIIYWLKFSKIEFNFKNKTINFQESNF